MLKSAFQAAAMAVLLLVPAVANASLQAGDVIRFLDGPGSPGGEYGVAMAGTSSPILFKTFCVESDEFLDFNAAGFKIESITTGAIGGGVSGGNPDGLDPRTAWLYLQFHNDTLANYVSNATQANKLQHAIWKLEGETHNPTTASEYYDLANQALADTPDDVAYAATRVRVLNITWATSRHGYAAGSEAQDVLYVIPEPATVVVWSALSCVGVLCYRRRHASKSA